MIRALPWIVLIGSVLLWGATPLGFGLSSSGCDLRTPDAGPAAASAAVLLAAVVAFAVLVAQMTRLDTERTTSSGLATGLTVLVVEAMFLLLVTAVIASVLVGPERAVEPRLAAFRSAAVVVPVVAAIVGVGAAWAVRGRSRRAVAVTAGSVGAALPIIIWLFGSVVLATAVCA